MRDFCVAGFGAAHHDRPSDRRQGMTVASRRKWCRYRTDIFDVAEGATYLDRDSSPESTVIVGSVCVLTERGIRSCSPSWCISPMRCRRRRRIATQGLGIVQYRDLGASGGRGVPLPCVDLKDKSERSVQDAAMCHEGPTILEDEGSPAVLSLLPAELSRARPRSAPGYSELCEGKPLVTWSAPILWRSTLARSGWARDGNDSDVDGVRPISMSFYSFVMRPGFDPMSSTRDEAGDPS